jgi:hypothetical protein
MKPFEINYKAMVEASLRDVVRQAMTQAAEHGLPGAHHFYITFRTDYPGVELPDYLKSRYPTEMTIVLQHQFHYLEVDERGFSVTLEFDKVPERLSIPFLALTMFQDPSVRFGLPFEPPPVPPVAPVETLRPVEAKPALKPVAESPAEGEKSGEVVSIDRFRKK